MDFMSSLVRISREAPASMELILAILVTLCRQYGHGMDPSSEMIFLAQCSQRPLWPHGMRTMSTALVMHMWHSAESLLNALSTSSSAESMDESMTSTPEVLFLNADSA